jgi:DNA repair protein RecN (Recombination protein N)
VLHALTIRDVVIIDALALDFAPGLNVLTGETGAGKSILLDSLGLALGARADAALVRQGADSAQVTAEFAVPDQHPARLMLREQGLDADGPLLLRRQVKADGGSRAFINDQPVGVALLRDVGAALVEIHGQHDERGLLNPKGHRDLLDAYAGITPPAPAYAAWQAAEAALTSAHAALEAAERDRDYISHAADELSKLAPEPGEEARLAEARQRLQRGEKAGADLDQVLEQLGGGDGALSRLRQAARKLERVSDLDPALATALAALDRAVADAADAEDAVAKVRRQLGADPSQLETLEARLFDLRAAARKHRCEVDALPALANSLAAQLAALKTGADALAATTAAARDAKAKFTTAAHAVRRARAQAAKALDAAVASEFAPLRLDKAAFRTELDALDESAWGPGGTERIGFTVATNPGAPFGPLIKIASGGELSRFILALKVVLASSGSAGALIFDEIDRGVGGAVAAAIGERLRRLASTAQVLVVTHSPQVAAAGHSHLRISKAERAGHVRTQVTELDAAARIEEIARMLSGDTVTPEARAQAARLLSA